MVFNERYRPRVRVVRVTGRSMCDAYFLKNREKVRYITVHFFISITLFKCLGSEDRGNWQL